MDRVLVTGANGFVGRAVCARLAADGARVRAAVRQADRDCGSAAEKVVVGSLGPMTDWSSAVANVTSVVHLAARVHQVRDRAADPLARFREVNVEATERLARAAAAAGARRLVYMSSVKALGEGREARYTAQDAPAPADPYGVSKWEAEQCLAAVARGTGLEVVILRPPLVYGPGVGANFLRLMDLVSRGAPLPFGAVRNRRSVLYVGNLADAVVAGLRAPQAAGRTYLVSDGDDVSTRELVQALAAALGRTARLIPVPPRLMAAAARAVGAGAAADRLLGSLIVDASAIRAELGWNPPFSLREGFAETARWYRSRG